MSTAADFLAAFPQTRLDHCTGGGCMAWLIELPNNRYILVTDPDDADVPDPHTTTVGCNSYDADGQCEQGDDNAAYAAKTWAEAIEFVRERLGEVHGR
jgi:hypothetical protein